MSSDFNFRMVKHFFQNQPFSGIYVAIEPTSRIDSSNINLAKLLARSVAGVRQPNIDSFFDFLLKHKIYSEKDLLDNAVLSEEGATKFAIILNSKEYKSFLFAIDLLTINLDTTAKKILPLYINLQYPALPPSDIESVIKLGKDPDKTPDFFSSKEVTPADHAMKVYKQLKNIHLGLSLKGGGVVNISYYELFTLQ